MTWAVRFEGVSKRYRGGGPRYASLREDLVQLGRRAAAALRGQTLAPEGITALDNISFEVQEGEAFALIGPNGAGKSTTLKLLSRISYPTSGRIRFRGRIGALIEVGSGVHPELTGRENIWLFGRILGMSRGEIARRFDEIVEFAELPHVLDTPLKMYSWGMQLRLGFAIASHIDPDIFVVDEALAVGDAGFQAKCVERMTSLVAQGKTLLFVSHDMSVVETICPRGLFLLDGRIEAIGKTRDVLQRYLHWVDTRQMERLGRAARSRAYQGLTIERVSFHDAAGSARTAFRTGDDIEVRLRVSVETPLRRPFFSIWVTDGRPGHLIHCSMLVDGNTPEQLAGVTTVSCRMCRVPLLPRVYQVYCSVRTSHGAGDMLDWAPVGAFRIAEGPPGLRGPGALAHTTLDAPIYTEYEWGWRPEAADLTVAEPVAHSPSGGTSARERSANSS